MKSKSSKQSLKTSYKDLLRIQAEEHKPSHDSKWSQLTADDAPFVREAIVRADAIRHEGLDAGDAYLQGVADLRAYQIRQELIASLPQPKYISTY
jgi:hypothetical protein